MLHSCIYGHFYRTIRNFFPFNCLPINTNALISRLLRFGTTIASPIVKGFYSMVTTPLKPPATGSSAQNAAQTLQDAKAKKAAQEFESIFTTMMLKSMRSATISQEDENQFLPTSLGEKIYTEMLDEEYGKMASKQGTLGLAQLILKQIEKNGGASMQSLQMLKGLKNQPWMLDKQFIPSSGQTVSNNPPPRLSAKCPNGHRILRQQAKNTMLIRALFRRSSLRNPAGTRMPSRQRARRGSCSSWTRPLPKWASPGHSLRKAISWAGQNT